MNDKPKIRPEWIPSAYRQEREMDKKASGDPIRKASLYARYNNRGKKGLVRKRPG